MLIRFLLGLVLIGGFGCCSNLLAAASQNPYLGAWALTIPGGHAGWLGVEEKNGMLSARLLWGWGSVEAVESARLDGDRLVITRKHNVEHKEGGRTIKTNLNEAITAVLQGDTIKLSSRKSRLDGNREDLAEFDGKRQPPMPPAPDLARVKFGSAVNLFNGENLNGWKLTDSGAVNGWSVRDGLLVNEPVQEDGKPHKNFGNLRTEQEFEDFNLQLEFRLGANGNSGVYLRGIYEVQVADSYGKPTSAHGLGGLYSRIRPATNPAKPPGQWQKMDITLVDRHLTVAVNGQTVIDNQPVEGCTGGALWSDVSRPGPIYFQGDHTEVEYRNLLLRSVLK